MKLFKKKYGKMWIEKDLFAEMVNQGRVAYIDSQEWNPEKESFLVFYRKEYAESFNNDVSKAKAVLGENIE